MKWRNSKERELLSAGGSRESTLPNKSNPNPDLSDLKQESDAPFDMKSHLDRLLEDEPHAAHAQALPDGAAPAPHPQHETDGAHYSGDAGGGGGPHSSPMSSPVGHGAECSDSEPESDEEEILVS